MNEIFLDTETTGLSFRDGHKIVEIACIETKDLIPTGNIFHKLINPKRSMPGEAYKIHGFSEEFLKDIKNIKRLERIIHPLVRNKMRNFTSQNKNKKFLFYEIPLLIESKLMKYFNIVIFIKAKKQLRLRRFQSKSGDKKLFNILNDKQMSDKNKIKYCDFVIVNEKNLNILKKNLLAIIDKYE